MLFVLVGFVQQGLGLLARGHDPLFQRGQELPVDPQQSADRLPEGVDAGLEPLEEHHLHQAAQVGPGLLEVGVGRLVLPARLLGRVASATLTFGAAGRARSQAEALLGRGDMLLIADGGEIARLQVPLVTEADLADIPRWESADRVPRLDLPEVVSWPVPPGVDRRGGWNRTPLDLEAVREAVENGATARDLQVLFGIHYDRARRLVRLLGGSDA